MTTSTFTPDAGFYLGFWPAQFASPIVSRALVDSIEKNPRDEKLTNALRRTEQLLAIWQSDANVWKQLEPLANRPGLHLPAPPKSPAEAGEWIGKARAAVHEAIKASGDQTALAAFAIGILAGNLYLALRVGRALRMLGAALVNHPAVKKRAADSTRVIAEDAPKLVAALAEPAWNPALAAHERQLSALLAQPPSLAAATTDEALTAWDKWAESASQAIGQLGPLIAIPSEPPVKGPATAEEQALLSEVLARPSDNAPRQRFAELAAARHDPRAELIRQQLAIAELDQQGALPYRITPHQLRAEQILKLHPDWRLPAELARLGVKSTRHHRGFIGQVEMDASDFLKNAEALYAVAPIEHLALRNAAGQIPALAASPHLDRIRSLILSDSGLGDADARALAASPHLGKLEYLNLYRNRIGDAGVEAIVSSPHLPSLVRLSIADNVGAVPAELIDFSDTDRQFAPTAFGDRLEAKYGKKPYFHEPVRPLPQDLTELVGR